MRRGGESGVTIHYLTGTDASDATLELDSGERSPWHFVTGSTG